MQAIRCVVFCLVAALLLGFGSAAAEDSSAFPTEISDPATYVPVIDETVAPDVTALPTTIGGDAVTVTAVPENPDATAPAEDDGDYPTEISDPATYVPETPEATVAGIATGGSSTGAGPQTLAVQQLPNAGSGTSSDSSLPWFLFVALAGFAGTMVIRIRRASRNA